MIIAQSNLTTKDSRGYTPIQWVLRHSDRPSSPEILELLLQKSRDSAKGQDLENKSALHHLGEKAREWAELEKSFRKQPVGSSFQRRSSILEVEQPPSVQVFRDSILSCFNKYMELGFPKTRPTSVVLTEEESKLINTLSTFPDWLLHEAVLNRNIQQDPGYCHSIAIIG